MKVWTADTTLVGPRPVQLSATVAISAELVLGSTVPNPLLPIVNVNILCAVTEITVGPYQPLANYVLTGPAMTFQKPTF